ncbi:MAG TPA: hypothetical protein VH165_32070 [Kofleriaceae bacterium]|jgi:hypothetical protein|nr:hypothetical protein [Kofleriaceae bacterium]
MRSPWIAAWIVSLSTLGCGPGPQAVPLKAPNTELIVGEYERHPPEGTTAIRFRGDGSVRLAKTKAELDGEAPIAIGEWKVDGNKLTLTYSKGACTDSAAEQTGVYTVVISRVGIHFTKVEDGCQRRSAIDGQTWWRIK